MKGFKPFDTTNSLYGEYYSKIQDPVTEVPIFNKPQDEENFHKNTLKLQEQHFNRYSHIKPPKKPEIIFVVGGPGAGKGTQCARLKSELGFETYSTGDILRGVVKEQKAEGWQQLQEDMIQGKLISSERLLFYLKHTLLNSGGAKILLDGFPRNQENLDVWDMLMKDCVELKGVLYFDCSNEEMKKRVLGRNEGRADDNEETIKKRIDTFEKETRPLKPQLETMGAFIRVDCNKSKEDIFQDIKMKLKEAKLI